MAGDEFYDDDVTSGPIAPPCPASREAIEEAEDLGEVGCPLCGHPAADHPRDIWT